MPILPGGADAAQVKACTKCREVKPLGHYYVRDRKTGRLFSRCKACHNAITMATFKKKYAADPEPFKAATRAYYAADPERRKAAAKQYREANRDAVRAASAAREATPECKAKRAAYREATAERRRAYNRIYRQLNAVAIAEANRAYQAANPGVYRDAARRWQAANPEKTKAIKARACATRRAVMASVAGSFTTDEWIAVKARYGNRCLCCGKPESEVTLTVDHVRPISKGGRNDAANLQPICGHCNSVKKDRSIDYRPDQGA